MSDKGGFKRIIKCILAAFIMLIVCYFFDNIPYPFRAKTSWFTFNESVIRNNKKQLSSFDSVVFVNTGYDIELVNTPNGRETITDRTSLLRFLKDLEDTQYKYIFIDIRFENELTTPVDSELVAQILSMPNILVAKHWDYENHTDFPLISDALNPKAAYCDYTYTLYNTSFSRYQFHQPNGPSAALVMYNNLNDRTINQHGFGFTKLYCDHCHPCFNSLFLAITDQFSKKTFSDSSAHYLNLGTDIYDWYTIDTFKSFCNNKIICIGNFVFDLHDTYYGKQPGTYLHWLAYDNLKNGKHIISWWFIIFMIAFYAAIFFCKTKRFDLAHYFKRKWLSFVVSLFGVGFILMVLSFIIYRINGIVISIFIPSFVFSIYNTYLDYKTYEN